ncbi:MAG: hypothetical protein HC880_18030 [Bacteroidia bacterium]|nr:hypothetical protein [Bacteroidia bacterium]
MLRAIRNIGFFNRWIRNFLSFLIGFYTSLSFRWRVAGVLNLQFYNLAFKYYAEGDDGIADAIFYQHNYTETSELRLFTEFSKQSKVILDVGANTGIVYAAGGYE